MRSDRGVRRPRGAAGRGPAEAGARRGRGADRGVPRRHQLRRHPPARELLPGALRAAAGARRRGGRRRTPDGRRVVALVGRGGYAEYAVAHEATVFPIPDGVDDGAALALLDPGPDRLAPVPDRARSSPRASAWWCISGAGGVGSLAVQLAKPFGAGRVIATASTEEKRAQTLELGADAAVDPAAEDLTARADRGQRAASRWTWCSRCPAGASSTRPLEALAPFGRIVAYGIAGREQNDASRPGRLMRKSRARGRLLADALPRPPGHDGGAAAPTCSTARRAASSCRRSAPPTRCPRSAGRTRTSRAGARAGSCCSIPRR